MKPLKTLFIPLLLLTASFLRAQVIYTFAGTGTIGSSGNGVPATTAQLFDPLGICADNAGNIYIADHGNHIIRKVNSAGVITTFAGNGTSGNNGDGGLAINAQLVSPYSVCADNAGNVYISDEGTSTIRKVNNAGIITLFAGNSTINYTGDGGPAILAGLGSITDICIDNAGNIYIADFGNSVVRKINTAGIISTIAGTGIPGHLGDGGPATSAWIQNPTGLSIDNNGNIYIAEEANSLIRKINSAGIISTFAGGTGMSYTGDGGPATAATFHFPYGVLADNNGNVYIGDTGNDVIRKVGPSGIVTTFAGTGVLGYSGDGGPAIAAQLIAPADMCIDNAGNIYVVDPGAHVVRKIGSCLLPVISLQPVNQSICAASGNTSFTITASNTTGFQWQVNSGTGWSDVTDNGIYNGALTNTLTITGASASMNNYQYRCHVSNACSAIYSSVASLLVGDPVTPTVNITVPSTIICAGDNITFFAAFSNGGITPSLQWRKNGQPVGTGSSAYNDLTLADGDVITCTLTSDLSCVTSATAVSNTIVMMVKPILIPTVSITASTDNVCAGTPITFTSSATNGGTAPAYTWFRNTTNLFLNSPVYTVSDLNDGDYVLCAMQSSEQCSDPSRIGVSNPIQVHINPIVTPSVTITASVASICPEGQVTFTALPANQGTTPSYQWQKNNSNVGINGPAYTETNLSAGDIITCLLTANGQQCLSTTTATAIAPSVTIYQSPVVNLDKTPTLCKDGNRQLDAGNFSTYRWNTGSLSRTISVNSIGTYYVDVTDNNSCKGTDTARITTLLPLPAGFLPGDTAICSYGSLVLKATPGFHQYHWNTDAQGSSITITQPGDYWLEVTDNNNCTGRETVTVSPKDCMLGFYIPNSFTPNGDGKNDLFYPLLFGNVKQYRFQVFNRWGQLLFQTTDLTRGWNGTLGGIKQDSNVFVWMCTYQFEGGTVKTERGTVVVLR